RPRDRDRHPLPRAHPPAAGVAGDVRRGADAATCGAGCARDALAARPSRPHRRRGRACRGERRALLWLMPPAARRPTLSILVPVYDEEGNVERLHDELSRVAADIATPYELVFVNDGSTDGTLARLEALIERDPNLNVVDLDGNFGEAAALSAGFEIARGDVVVTLDG